MPLHLNKLKSGKSAIFCGAGISRHSGLPLANELVSYVLHKLFNARQSKYIREIKASNLPFEGFMETLLGHINISEILDIFEDGKPNTNHIWIAKLAKNGYVKTILTTNFDLLIEKALEQEGLKRDKDFKVYFSEDDFSKIHSNNIDDKIRVFKIHGSIEDRNSVRTTLKAVANKLLSDKRMALIRHLFLEENHKSIFVIGYSCSDEFDITPQIQSIEGSRKEITFIDHVNSSIEKIEKLGIKKGKNPFKHLSGVRIKCNTDRFIEKYWNLMERELKEEYAFVNSATAWKKHIDIWSKHLQGENRPFKYLCIGAIFDRVSNVNKAIQYYRKALRIAVNRSDEKLKAKCHACMGDSCDRLGAFDRALEYHRKSLRIVRKLKDKQGEIRCYSGMGNVYHGLGDFNKSINYHEEALRIATAIDNSQEVSKCYSNLGNAYQNLGNFSKAIENLRRALEIAEFIGDKMMESMCCTNLGSVYFYSKEFLKSIEYYSRSLRIKKLIGDVGGEAQCLTGLGIAYRNLGETSKAIDYHRKSLLIAIKVGEKVLESRCYTNLGNTYKDLGEFTKAIRNHNLSLKIAKAIGYKTGEAICYANLGSAYFGLKDFKAAIKYFLNGEKIFKEQGQMHHLKTIYNDLYQTYKAINDYKNEKRYRKLATAE